MANIQGINRKEFDAEFKKFEEADWNLGNGFAYKLPPAVKSLKEAWSGKRINAILTYYNNMMPKIKDYNVYIRETLQPVLYEIKMQYETMEDKGKAVDQSWPTRVITSVFDAIPLTDENNVKFNESKVLEAQQQIIAALSQITKGLDGLVPALDKIGAYSDSLAKYKSIYTAKTNEFSSIIKEFSTKLKQEIQAEIDVVSSTEKINQNDVSKLN